MRPSTPKLKRILAIDPSTRGFGYTVLEGPDWLIDWGVKEVHGDKNLQSLKVIQRLIDCYQPDLVVLEDCMARGSLRHSRVQKLIQKILALCRKKQIRTRSISRLQVRRVFAVHGTRNKHQIATAITKHFPELLPWLPPPREGLWIDFEDRRMSIFDAFALAQIVLPHQVMQSDETKCMSGSPPDHTQLSSSRPYESS